MTLAYWAWPSVDVIYGECGWVMSPCVIDERPRRRLVYCTNYVCKHAFRIFEIKTKDAIELVLSGLPDVKVTRM